VATSRVLDVLLMRHGAPEYPAEVYPDPFALALSVEGRREAAKGAAAVRRFRPDFVLSSDFLRAAETAEIVTAGIRAKPEMTPSLRERVYYSLAGMTFSEIIRRYGDNGTGMLGGNSDFLDLPGEEGYSEARNRVVSFFKELFRVEACNRALVVCHGGPHAWLVEEALGVDLRGVRNFTLRTGYFSRFTITESGFSIEAMNVPPSGVDPPATEL
jgi:broad specificity phosphatase PhoE